MRVESGRNGRILGIAGAALLAAALLTQRGSACGSYWTAPQVLWGTREALLSAPVARFEDLLPLLVEGPPVPERCVLGKRDLQNQPAMRGGDAGTSCASELLDAYADACACIHDDPALASERFAGVRARVRAGEPDPDGLAAASYGWEAFAWLRAGDLDRATDLYLRQWRTGDPTAIPSLCSVAARASQRLPGLRPTGLLLRLMVAYKLSLRPWCLDTGRPEPEAWKDLARLEDKLPGPLAAQVAWVHYHDGRYPEAEAWAKSCPDQPMAQWLSAKLALRAGRQEEAAAAYAKAVATLDDRLPMGTGDTVEYFDDEARSPKARAMAESGALKLHRKEYRAALEALMNADYRTDALYLADRVLTIGELQAFVAARAGRPARPPPIRGADDSGGWTANDLLRVDLPYRLAEDGRTVDGLLRACLAQRLARAGRWAEAKAYFPDPDDQKRVDEWLAAEKLRKDGGKAERAEALWTQACLLADHGASLVGDIESMEGLAKARRGEGIRGDPFSAARDEVSRAHRHAPPTVERMAHLYMAADLAWESCRLLPDGTDLLAGRLWRAGSWLAKRSYLEPEGPVAARRFYVALVERCPGTETGRKAREHGWFTNRQGSKP